MQNIKSRPDQLLEEDLLHLASIQEIVPGFLHEMSQPLNAISLAGQLLDLKLIQLQTKELDVSYFSAKLGVITEGIQRASKIMDDLRAFNDRGTIAPKGANIREVFDKIYGLMTRQFINREVAVQVHSDGDLSPIVADLRLAQCAIVQSLVFARDSVLAIYAWHIERSRLYEKSLNVELTHRNGTHVIRMSWDLGSFPSDESEYPLESGTGLKAAEVALVARGSQLDVGSDYVQAILVEG